MEKINSLLTPPQRGKTALGGVNSPFNDAVDRALDTLGESKKDFSQWCGRLRGFHPSKISELAAKAREGKRPIALFVWLIKEAKKKV